ncbi:hypothetical protein FXO37_19725 [Capsicum annuum]|nr:hypothetical protein FXO37_19725 [Capsicum annuum]
MIYFNHLSEEVTGSSLENSSLQKCKMMLHPHSGKDQPLSHWKPLFSGKSVVHQLDLITDLHGTPSADIISGVRNEKARKYLTDMKKKSPVPFTKKFQKADLLALRLLQRMQWGMAQRCDGLRSKGTEETVDRQVKCENWIRGEDDNQSEQSKSSWWLNRLITGQTKKMSTD